MALTPGTWLNGTVVTPAFLQSIENFFNAGTFSAYSLYLDGSGGNAVTAPPAGTLRLSGTAGGTSAPTNAVTANVLYSDSIIRAWVKFSWGGTTVTFLCGFNISSLTFNSTGIMSVAPVTNLPGVNFGTFVSGISSNGVVFGGAGGAANSFTIESVNSSGTLTNPTGGVVCAFFVGG